MVIEKKFNLFEFLRVNMPDGQEKVFDPSGQVLEKILNWIFILSPIRWALNWPIVILTAFRSEDHERQQGRDGTSQHVFRGEGAIDLRAKPSPLQKLNNFLQWNLAVLLLDSGKIGRIAYYPQRDKENSFFHIDCKVPAGENLMFVAKNNGKWVQIEDRATFLELVLNRRHA